MKLATLIILIVPFNTMTIMSINNKIYFIKIYGAIINISEIDK